MKYLRRKFISMFFTLWIVVSVTFILMKAVPGDPFTDEASLHPSILKSLQAHYGLDQPLHKQYIQYLGNLLKGDLGPSLKYKNRTVNAIIKEGFSVSLLLSLEALLLAVTAGCFLGALAAVKKKQYLDNFLMIFATLGISLPSFVIASILQYFLALKLHLFPVGRWDSFAHTILPSVSLAILPAAFIMRLVRSNLLEVMKKEYITTARSKGLSQALIIVRHALRNSLLPVVSYLGQIAANILTGNVIIEKIFGIPGLGQWFVNSIMNRDYSVIIGITVFYSAILILAIFLVDLIYIALDPRIRFENE